MKNIKKIISTPLFAVAAFVLFTATIVSHTPFIRTINGVDAFQGMAFDFSGGAVSVSGSTVSIDLGLDTDHADAPTIDSVGVVGEIWKKTNTEQAWQLVEITTSAATETISQVSGVTNEAIGATPEVQTFTPTVTGDLTNLELWLYTTTGGTANIELLDGATVMATSNDIVLSATEQYETVTWTGGANTSLTASTIYTIRINRVVGQLRTRLSDGTSDLYTGGAYEARTNVDMKFRYTVDAGGASTYVWEEITENTTPTTNAPIEVSNGATEALPSSPTVNTSYQYFAADGATGTIDVPAGFTLNQLAAGADMAISETDGLIEIIYVGSSRFMSK